MHKSPSKISLHRLCKRKFYAVYVLEMRDDGPRPGPDLGTDVHALLELYLAEGVFPSADAPIQWQQSNKIRAVRCAQALLSHLPHPDEVDPDQCEKWIEIDLPDGTLMRGRVDFNKTLTIRLIAIVDFKTTSDFRYMKTVEEMRYDPQVITYGYGALLDYRLNSDVYQVSITFDMLYTPTRSVLLIFSPR